LCGANVDGKKKKVMKKQRKSEEKRFDGKVVLVARIRSLKSGGADHPVRPVLHDSIIKLRDQKESLAIPFSVHIAHPPQTYVKPLTLK
jgi:hypothetical protein